MKNNSCSFIGSRLCNFSFGYDGESEKCINLTRSITEYINDMYAKGVRDFYSLCQEGAELWAAEYVTHLMYKDSAVKLHIIMPFEEQANKWHPDTRELFFNVHAAATDCKIMNTHYSKDAFALARYEAINSSDYVLAASANDDGEISRLIDYAAQSGKTVYTLPQ